MGEKLWGVWGGREPGGWCLIDRSYPRQYFGSRDEADEIATQLKKENPDKGYTVLEFDTARLPVAQEHGRPTPAGARFMEKLLNGRSFNGAVMGMPQWRQITDPLFAKGWIFHLGDDCIVTPAGQRALARIP